MLLSAGHVQRLGETLDKLNLASAYSQLILSSKLDLDKTGLAYQHNPDLKEGDRSLSRGANL